MNDKLTILINNLIDNELELLLNKHISFNEKMLLFSKKNNNFKELEKIYFDRVLEVINENDNITNSFLQLNYALNKGIIKVYDFQSQKYNMDIITEKYH
jgi:hypothetical protein